MDSGTVGEIRGWAGQTSRIPNGWQVCQGQTLQITQNQALYSIIGTLYGGDGVKTFQLPDLQGRIPIGTGRFNDPVSGTPYVFTPGNKMGTMDKSITTNNLPAHAHQVSIGNLPMTATGTGTITPICLGDTGDQSTPKGNAPANINNGYASAADATDSMAPTTATFNLTGTVTGGTVVSGPTGTNIPFNVSQPVLAINWLICITGMYPDINN